MILCEHCAGPIDPTLKACQSCGQPFSEASRSTQTIQAETKPAAIEIVAQRPTPRRVTRINPDAETDYDLAPRRRSNSSANATGFWKPAAIVLTLVAIVAVIGWIKTGYDLGNARNTLDSTQSDLSERRDKETQQAQKITQLETDLKNEKDRLQSLAESWPVTMLDVKLFNHNGTEKIGDSAMTFSRYEIRYIQFYVTLKNNFGDKNQLNGNLQVKYILPDGSLSRNSSSPSGYTLEIAVANLGDAPQEVSRGWGSSSSSIFTEGTHRIQFWWDGKIIGEAEFEVN